MHFQATRIKSLKTIFFNVKELLKTCLDKFPDHQNQGLTNLFLTSGVVNNAFPGHQNQVLIKAIFQRLKWLKTCFDAFPDHQNKVLKKLFFLPLEWLKTCFDAFAHTSRPPESSSSRYSGVVKTCFDAFPGLIIKSLKKIFFNAWSGLKCVLMHL